MIDFEVFAKECLDRGYVAKKQSADLFYIKTKNGVKHEVKETVAYGLTFVTGWGRSDDEVDIIKEEIVDQGLTILNKSKKFAVVSYTNFEDFFSLADTVENIANIKRNGKAYKLFENKFCPLTIANRYFFAIENEDQGMLDLGRALLESDSHDKEISYNEKTAVNDYREHVVPCIMIHNKAVEMVLDGETKDAVAEMIRQNLRIVHIPTSAANSLDTVLGMKTTMPEGWVFGNSIFARLDFAGIKY